jgi:hypothetical protein
MNWIQALKKWNSQDNKSGNWCVPKKGTTDHSKVKSYMSSKKNKDDDETITMVEERKPKTTLKKPTGVIKKKLSKSEKKKMEMEAIAEAKKLGGQINRAFSPAEIQAGKQDLKQLMKNSKSKSADKMPTKPTESVNTLVPRSIKKVKTTGSSIKKAFDEIMDRFQIKGDPKTYFIPGKLKKLFLDDIANTALVYNVEGQLEEIMESRGPRLALTYAQNTIPPGFKEAKSVLLK